MPLIKTLSQALRMDKERFKVPKSVQQAIPIQRIWPDGIFQQGTKFSKTYRFTDINYYIASKDNKTEMFLDYSELLNCKRLIFDRHTKGALLTYKQIFTTSKMPQLGLAAEAP